jgi:CBS domain-containing protein
LPPLTPAAEWLAAQPGPFRVYSPSYSLPAGDGLEHVDGVDPLQLADTVAFLEPATGVKADAYSVTIPAFNEGELVTANRDAVSDPALLGLLNVRYVASEFPLTVTGLEPVTTIGTTFVYENADWRPRAWVEGGIAEVVTWTPNRITVAATGPGRLVLSEVAYPGWRARVDGEPALIVTAHDLLRAVDLPGGAHEVVFEYRPASVYVGAGLSLLGVVCFLALLWRDRRAAW